MSTPDDRLKDVFDQAAEIPDPAARAAFLDRACGGDAALRGRVDALLRAHDAAGSFLAHLPAAAAGDNTVTPGPEGDAPTAAWAGPPDSGTVLAGKYKLLERIGEGGMGAVWAAEQRDPVKRLVAVKLIKAGIDSRTLLARFEAERQALAVMDHPNIAKILDAGSTADGRPFFVMELVKGVPITRFCDDHKLTPRQRLELFVPVCQAIQHAHQKGVIHRDVKPSNVLVALYDDRPVPKVIDFGVAKAVGAPLTEHTLQTGFGAVVGTPEYMSPEQAAFNQLDVDTRTDVYALGVLLYELLTGSTPLTRQRAGRVALLEVLRLVREEEPPCPSRRLSTAEGLPALAANRGTEPRRLTALVRGELDWVVMKALEKDRARRYETANGLARDVERYLADEPVEAGRPGAGYRAWKLVRRNRGPVAAAVLLVVALVAGIAGTTAGLVRAERARAAEAEQRQAAEDARAAEADQRQAAEGARAAEAEQRKVAEAKEAEANAVVKFFEDRVFAAVRPKGQDGGLGRDVALRDAIAAGMQSLSTAFADQPLVEARLREVLGKTLAYLGEVKAAAEQDERARELHAKVLGPDHPDTLKSTGNLAGSNWRLGRRTDAVRLYEETLAARKRVLGPDHPMTLRTTNDLVRCYKGMGRYADALRLQEDALATCTRAFGPDHPDTLKSLEGVAGCHLTLRHRAMAVRRQSEALAARTRVQGPYHLDRLQSLVDLARFHIYQGRHDEAVRRFREALTDHTRFLGADHPETLEALHAEASFYGFRGLYDDAVLRFEKVLEASKRVRGPEHPGTFQIADGLAANYARLGRHADALAIREETLAARKRAMGPDHPDTLANMHAMARTWRSMGRQTDAVRLLEEASAAYKRVLAPDHPDTLDCERQLAGSYLALGRRPEALALLDKTLAADKRVLGPDHMETIVSMWGVADALVALNRGTEAVPLIDDCLARMARPRVDLQSGHHSGVIALRFRHFRKAVDPNECRATAAIWESLARVDADGLYTAARYRAVTAGLYAGANLPAEAAADADRAMGWLTKAVAAGFTDAARLTADPDLAALRSRPDFQALAADLAVHREVAPPPRPAVDYSQALARTTDIAFRLLARVGYADAGTLSQKVRSAYRRVLGPDNPATLMSMAALANDYERLGRYADALGQHNAMLATRRRVFGPNHPDTLVSMQRVAACLTELDRGAEAVLIIDAFMSIQQMPGVRGDPRAKPGMLDLRVRHFRTIANPAECRATAVRWEHLNRRDFISSYTAARYRAAAAEVYGRTNQPAEAAADADRAMGWLTKAVADGFADTARLTAEPDLAVLRSRPDFQALVAELAVRPERAPRPRPVRK